MPIPRKHHYLPKWYLSRWMRPSNGERVIWEFCRKGPQNKLKSRACHPSATGFKHHLYTIPNQDAEEAAEIETEFLQKIDYRGASAVSMAEQGEAAGPADKLGLVQFMLSMMHRSPVRIEYLQERLTQSLAENPLFDDKEPDVFRTGALDAFVTLLQSKPMIKRMMQMHTFVINLSDEAHDLLTSDSPIMMSNGINHKDSFVMLPIGPRKLIMLAEDKALTNHLMGHDAKILSKAMNDAVIIQAKKLVFASNNKQTRFIDNRLNRPNLHTADTLDPVTGFVKWKI